MLAGARLGNHARLAHAAGEENLADGVVDFVRAGMVEVLAFEIYFGAAKFARETFGKIKRRGAAAELLEIIGQLTLKFWVLLRAEIFRLELLERMHQGLRHVTSAIRPKMALGVGQGRFGNCAHADIFTQRGQTRKGFSRNR